MVNGSYVLIQNSENTQDLMNCVYPYYPANIISPKKTLPIPEFNIYSNLSGLWAAPTAPIAYQGVPWQNQSFI